MKNFRKALLGLAVSSMMLVGCGETKEESANSYQTLLIEDTIDNYKDQTIKVNGVDYYAISLVDYAKKNSMNIPSSDVYVNAMDSDGGMHGYLLNNSKDAYILLGCKEEVDTLFPALYANNETVNSIYKLYVEANPFKNTIKGEISIANYGVMEFELYPNVAPVSVANFTKLAKDGFYDGLIIHRIADLGYTGDDYIVQMGGFESGTYLYNKDTKSANTITGEFLANGFYNALNHSRGVMAMARSTAKNSATSQIYFVVDGCEALDNNYATFGKVTKNIEILDELIKAETDSTYYWPTNEIQIEYIKIK